ncbi:uncharacterized protein KY384_002181 [Bacidia gigantensis]|uniref:uncharacterized protein n=1 Tax=Bacidia gigantensis TaxID=2732470 RepID=UPI001D03640A|nr:uncharacterized protein KY384_002181 [Bacidia gigantensis]KAG8533398.1 hypothetical protein KY384_002181 [Bacidia gigantensis]
MVKATNCLRRSYPGVVQRFQARGANILFLKGSLRRSYAAQAVAHLPSELQQKIVETPDLRTHRSPITNGRIGSDIYTQLNEAAEVIQTTTVPTENALLDALRSCQQLAQAVSSESALKKQRSDKQSEGSASRSSPIVDLSIRQSSHSQRELLRDKITDMAYRIVTDPKTFMSPSILETYVSTLCTLHRPQSFPYIFDLYAVKPIPNPGTSPTTYSEADPNSVKAAVPLQVASAALDAAIESRDLALCLSVISTTVSTQAYIRNRCLRRAGPAVTAVGTTPLISYQLAVAWADYSDRLEPGFAFWMSFACFMTFFASTSVTGYVGVTTAYNSNRVVWRSGTPLHRRWTRKQEREFADRVADAWGFRSHLKRGEEEGEEWAFLKEWTKERSMHLDKPELMEGME